MRLAKSVPSLWSCAVHAAVSTPSYIHSSYLHSYASLHVYQNRNTDIKIEKDSPKTTKEEKIRTIVCKKGQLCIVIH